ncbi:MAG: FtsW/RodA/SpoVE family cell cycle protein [Kiritimatiellae bacterium]|nr:FtsW/RodA/SpoVE family cell cycle protein [Kiritimatiellia bacterium]
MLFIFGLVTTALVVLGLVILSSAGQRYGVRLYGNEGVNEYIFLRGQLKYVGIALVVATLFACFDYRNWRNYPFLTIAAYISILILLVLVLFTDPIKGSRRWLDLKFFNFQPGEMAKIFTVIAVAAWLDRSSWRVGLWKNGFWCPIMIIGLFAGLVIAEPDFGSFMVIGLAGLLMMVLGGVQMIQIFIIFLIGFIGFVGYLIHNPNRMARLAAWLGVSDLNVGAKISEGAAEQADYQVNQALIAFKNGGYFGVGLNQSMQKYHYLPEAHTDFIFAIGAEELGMVFTIPVFLLFVLFFILALYIARKSCDKFGRSLAYGMAFLIFFQAMFNMGVVCKAFPTKGMALPFFSYGGTNMLSSAIAVGTILSVGIQSLKEKRRALLRKVVLR